MSHFTVLVVGGDVKKMLAPFQENNMGDCPKEYLDFDDEEDEYRKQYEEEDIEMVRCPDGSLVYTFDERFRVSGFGIGTGTHHIPEECGYERVQVKYTDKYKTFEEFMADFCGYKERDPEKGRYGHWENPNAKWDWYEVGGRWTGFFKLKDGAQGATGRPGILTNPARPGWADQAHKKDIDFDAMIEDAAKRAMDAWEKALQDKDECSRFFHFGIKKGETKEQHVENARKNACTTFAVLKDGIWYERGEMGWFGCVGNEKEDCSWKDEFMKLFDAIGDDELLTVVDCHI